MVVPVLHSASNLGAARGVLLAGVSALALAIAMPRAQAEDVRPGHWVPKTDKGKLRVWGEGGGFWTGGEPINSFFNSNIAFYVTTPGVVPQTPKFGWDAGIGFDYRFPGSPYHVNAQVRYGQATNSFFTASSAAFAIPGGTNLISFAATDSATVKLKETHGFADFAVGRDLGLGRDPLQVNVGIRVAQITAKTDSVENGQLALNFSTPQVFYGVLATGLNGVSTAIRQEKSSFLGVGPRIGIEGAAPLGGGFTFDYLGDLAVLFGRQRFSRNTNTTATFSTVPPGGVLDLGSLSDSFDSVAHPPVLNADLQAGLSYWLNPNLKVTASYRIDAYFRALTAVAVDNDLTRLARIDRYYHGPRLGLTGTFGDDPPASGAQAYAMATNAAPLIKGQFTAWAEGGAIWTGGQHLVSVYDSFVGFPFDTSRQTFALRPKVGWEGAVGVDHRFAGSPWHASAQFRYGEARSATASVASAFNAAYYGTPFSISQSVSARSKENHWLADFAIGRDVGIGHGTAQLKAGVRVAEISARLNTRNSVNETITGINSTIGGVPITGFNIAALYDDTQRTSFRGIGPRVGIEGTVPLKGGFSFEYQADAAVLFGTRRWQQVITTTATETSIPPVVTIPFGGPFGGSSFGIANQDNVVVFNGDAQLGFSYWVTPNVKVTASYRADAFLDALVSLDQNNDPNRLTKVNRIFHGPRLGVSGTL